MAYFGNQYQGQHPPVPRFSDVAMLGAKPIPGTNKVVASFSPGHGRAEHQGYITVVDPALGPDVPQAARRLNSQRQFRDPYPLSEDRFLVADREGIWVMDGQGRTERIYALPAADTQADLECHEPRPLRARPREPVLPPALDLSQSTGVLMLSDIYRGRNMDGVQRGEIKRLLVLEQLSKPVQFSGGQEPLTIGGSFTLQRVLGTVPVEPDGSAFLELPAGRPLFFVALDENDLSVKRMQSFLTVQPGERRRVSAVTNLARRRRTHRRRRWPPCAGPAASNRSGRCRTCSTFPATSNRSWTGTASSATTPTAARAASN
jgi:hypothetical protein